MNFGHALQHMLTKQDESLVAGTSGIERDAVELPSQFMENWLYLRIWKRTLPVPTLPENRFLCSFHNVFSGGYAAGFYGYKWAEVLSVDAFAVFEEVGFDDNEGIKETGCRFRDTILALGGGKEPLDVFVEFRRRLPSTDALLRHHGLLTSSA